MHIFIIKIVIGVIYLTMLPVLQKAVSNGTVIVMCTQCLKGAAVLGTYEVSSALKAAGAVSGADIMAEVAVTKLYSLFSRTDDREEIKRLMAADICGEMTGEKTWE